MKEPGDDWTVEELRALRDKLQGRLAKLKGLPRPPIYEIQEERDREAIKLCHVLVLLYGLLAERKYEEAVSGRKAVCEKEREEEPAVVVG